MDLFGKRVGDIIFHMKNENDCLLLYVKRNSNGRYFAY